MFWYAIIGINLFTLILMGLDKRFARRKSQRISEKSLILLACFGGSLGMWSGMYLWRHKTQKIKFYLGIPVIVFVQCVVFYYFYWRIL